MLNKVKKLIAIFLLTVYTATAFGVPVNYHYCNGHLALVSFLNFGGKSGCSCNKDAMPKGCCKDEMHYKKADSHKTVQESYTINTVSFTPDLPPVSNLHDRVLQGGSYDSDLIIDRARRSCSEPIYLLNQLLEFARLQSGHHLRRKPN